MGTFHPRVQCKGVISNPHPCGNVLADMPATTELEVFGPPDTPLVTEVLPQEIVSGEFPASSHHQNL